MTDYYRMGRINEWLEDNECHKTDENKLDFYSIVQMRTLFRFWDGVSITHCRLNSEKFQNSHFQAEIFIFE